MIKKLTLHDIFHEDAILPISVNFNNVTYYSRDYVNNGTTIYFVNGSRILVRETKEQIDNLFSL